MSTTSSTKPGAKEVVLVASGDSRLAANQRCWPAQQALEKAVDKAFGELGARIMRGHAVRRREEARLHRRAGAGDPDLPQDRSRGAARRGRGRVGVHEPHPRRPDEAPRPDPHARQLERPVAGARRDAERQRLADEGGDPLQLDLERGLRGRLRARGGCASGSARAASPTTRATRSRSRTGPSTGNFAERPGARPQRSAKRSSATRRSWASSTRAAWGCTTRSSPTTCMHAMGLFKERLSQSMLYAAMRRGARRDGAAPLRLAEAARGMTFALGRRRGDRAHRVAGARGPEDVRRGRARWRTISAARRSASSTSRA